VTQEFAIPMTGKYNSRISKTTSLPTASGVVGVGVVGVMVVGLTNSIVNKDERWINCFYTKEGGIDYATKRPGFTASNTPASGNIGSAILVWTGASNKVMTCFGDTNSTLYDGTTSKGAITGVAKSITETKAGSNVATIMIPSSDSTGWYYDNGSTVAVATKIVDVDFPGNAGYTLAGNFVSIDGYNCIMTTDGKLWASDLNSVTSWTATSFDTASDYPDAGVGAARWKDKILTFGTESVQFWYNAGLTPFPLSQVGGSSTLKLGAISSDAITAISDYVFWCGGTDKGGLTVYMWDGSLSRISSPEIDFQLVLSGITSISLTSLRVFGKSFILVNTNTTTFVYCIEDQRWHEWQPASYSLWYRCSGLSSGSSIITYSISNTSTAGKVYTINQALVSFQDDGNNWTSTIQTMNDDSGSSNSKFYSEFRLDADIESAYSPVTVSYSDDDFQTFTSAGMIDLNNPQPIFRLGGSSKSNWNRRAWRLTHNTDTAFRIRKATYKASVGRQ
jgi:hypothetical protein